MQPVGKKLKYIKNIRVVSKLNAQFNNLQERKKDRFKNIVL